MLDSLIIVFVNGIFLLIFHHVNPGQKMERYFVESEQESNMLYYAAILAYTVVWLAFAMNARHLVKRILSTAWTTGRKMLFK